jgi:hypothetical protein
VAEDLHLCTDYFQTVKIQVRCEETSALLPAEHVQLAVLHLQLATVFLLALLTGMLSWCDLERYYGVTYVLFVVCKHVASVSLSRQYNTPEDDFEPVM